MKRKRQYIYIYIKEMKSKKKNFFIIYIKNIISYIYFAALINIAAALSELLPIKYS